MTTKTFCDKCKKEINPYKEVYIEARIGRMFADNYHTFKFEICRNCFEKVKDLLENKI